MAKSFSVGDYIRLGHTSYLYFRVDEINKDFYTITRCLPGGKSISAPRQLVDSPGTTFNKCSKAEVILFTDRKPTDLNSELHKEIFLKILDVYNTPKGFRPLPPSYGEKV